MSYDGLREIIRIDEKIIIARQKQKIIEGRQWTEYEGSYEEVYMKYKHKNSDQNRR